MDSCLEDYSQLKNMVKNVSSLPRITFSQASKMVIAWIEATIKKGSMYSVPCEDQDNFSLMDLPAESSNFMICYDRDASLLESRYSDRFFFAVLKLSSQRERLPDTDQPKVKNELLVQRCDRWLLSQDGKGKSVELFRS